MRRRSFVAAPSRGARRDLSQAGLRRVKRASGAAAYRPSGSAAQTAFSYPVRGARTARVVCRGDGEWARREGPSAGDGCSAAGSGRPSPAANAESVGEERQAGTEAEAAVPQKIANRRRAKRFFVLPPKYRRLLPSFRQGGKRFYCFPVVARNVSAVPRRRAWRNEPTV